jgi:hypothetical protein
MHAVTGRRTTPDLPDAELQAIGETFQKAVERCGMSMAEFCDSIVPPPGRNTRSRWSTGRSGPPRAQARQIDEKLAEIDKSFESGSLLRRWWPDHPALQTGFPAASGPGVRDLGYRLDGEWAGVWVYLDEHRKPVGFVDRAVLEITEAGAKGRAESRRLFGSFRQPQTTYAVDFMVEEHGLALGRWWTEERVSTFKGVLVGELRDSSNELDCYWLGNFRDGVRPGRLRWFRMDGHEVGAAFTDDDKRATQEAAKLVELLGEHE